MPPQKPHLTAAFQGTESRRRQIMTGNRPGLSVFTVFADSGPQHFCTDAGSNAAYHMHRSAAGKVMKAQLRQPPASPDPVAGNGINNQLDHSAVNTVCFEIRPFCHGSGYDGSCRSTEHRLKNHITHNRKRSKIIAAADKRIKSANQRAGTAGQRNETFLLPRTA